MGRLNYFFFRFGVFCVSISPFPLVYALSDLLRFVLHKVLKYRVPVVRENLLRVFPEKSDEQRSEIETKFYRSLCDLILESFKGNGTSDAKIAQRAAIINPSFFLRHIEKGESVLFLAAHQGNWEWYAASLANMKFDVAVVFKPLRNKLIDTFLKNKRSRGAVEMVGMGETNSAFIEQNGKPRMVALVADQNPSNPDKGHWVNFFGTETAFIHGPEKYSRQTNWPVYFAQVLQPKRGYYEAVFHLLAEDPSALAPGELTKIYAAKLEEVIREQPETWLWSHKRWKHKRS